MNLDACVSALLRLFESAGPSFLGLHVQRRLQGQGGCGTIFGADCASPLMISDGSVFASCMLLYVSGFFAHRRRKQLLNHCAIHDGSN